MTELGESRVVALQIDAATAADPSVAAAIEGLVAALADADMLEDGDVAGFAKTPAVKFGEIGPTRFPAGGGKTAPTVGSPTVDSLFCIGMQSDDVSGGFSCGLYW